MTKPSGPLAGLRVLEFASIGPGPHCAMLLADMGADVLIEGLRPGVMERLGLGPAVALERNPRLIYGRMTGWGQSGPLAQAAGHDINYIALAGALAAIGRPGAPAVPPLNLVGDFGGGSMFLAFGILAALFERERSGIGQVVDAAMIDGVSSLMTMFSGVAPAARLSLERERSMLGGAAPFYRCYFCSDGVEIAVGAIEPEFYAELLDKIGAPAEFHSGQNDIRNWPERSRVLEEIFRSRTSQHWQSLLEGTDACFSVVMPFGDAPSHPHMNARDTYVRFEGLLQAAPAPRFCSLDHHHHLTPRLARPEPGDRLAAARERKALGHRGLDAPMPVHRHQRRDIRGVQFRIAARELSPEHTDDLAALEQR